MTAYADANDMVARFDERTLSELCSDNDEPVATLSTDAKMLAALDDATGMIKSALLIGRQYNPDDLDNLTGESQSYLKRLTCEIALSYLIGRRPEKYGKQGVEIKKNVDEILDMFRRGVRVLDIESNKGAGLPTIDGPTHLDYQRLNLLRNRTRHFYPSRQSSLPLGR